jgi:hypothetical protein
MKNIILFTITIWLFTIQSCSNTNNATGNQTQVQPQMSLAGKVYGLSTATDTTKCEQALPGNAYLPALLFLDNSSFIKIIPTSCNDIGNDFTCSRHYCGKYKMDDKQLTLTFDPNMVVHFIKSKNNPKSKTPLLSTHVELEKSDLTIETLVRLNCKSTPCFQVCDAQSHLMIPTTDTLTNHVKYLIDEKIWDKLFGIN